MVNYDECQLTEHLCFSPQSYPLSATTLHFDFYTDVREDKGKVGSLTDA